MNCFLLLLNKPRLLASVPKVDPPVASKGFWVACPKRRSRRGARKQYMRKYIWIIFLLRSEQNELLLETLERWSMLEQKFLGEESGNWERGLFHILLAWGGFGGTTTLLCVFYVPSYDVELLLIVIFPARRDLHLLDHLRHLVYIPHVELITWFADSVLGWRFLLEDPTAEGRAVLDASLTHL